MAVKVKALITLVVGKAQEFAPGQECEVSDEEVKPEEKQGANNDNKPDDKQSGGQSVPETGATGGV